MGIDLIILIPIVLLLIMRQVVVFHRVTDAILRIKRLFPSSDVAYSYVGGEISFHSAEYCGLAKTDILESINRYLKRNREGLLDFHIIKDTVERNTAAMEEEVQVQQPVPLYMGLMGTMTGIIVGVGALAFGGGLDELSHGLGISSIGSLLLGVSIAMTVSLVGIMLSTLLSLRMKSAKIIMEKRKHAFLSWIQSELLPAVSTDVSSALVRMSENLQGFNNRFATNADRMERIIEQISDAAEGQAAILQFIQNQDMVKVSTANLKIYSKLMESVEEFSKFERFMSGLNSAMDRIANLTILLERNESATGAMHEMAAYFRNERQQILDIQQGVSTLAGQVSSEAKETIEQFHRFIEEHSTGMESLVVNLVDRFKQFTEGQRETLEKYADLQPLADLASLQRQVGDISSSVDSLLQRMDGLGKTVKERRRLLESVE